MSALRSIPAMIYNASGDMLEVYWRNEACHAVTVVGTSRRIAQMIGLDSGDIVGVKVYGIRGLTGGTPMAVGGWFTKRRDLRAFKAWVQELPPADRAVLDAWVGREVAQHAAADGDVVGGPLVDAIAALFKMFVEYGPDLLRLIKEIIDLFTQNPSQNTVRTG